VPGQWAGHSGRATGSHSTVLQLEVGNASKFLPVPESALTGRLKDCQWHCQCSLSGKLLRAAAAPRVTPEYY